MGKWRTYTRVHNDLLVEHDRGQVSHCYDELCPLLYGEDTLHSEHYHGRTGMDLRCQLLYLLNRLLIVLNFLRQLAALLDHYVDAVGELSGRVSHWGDTGVDLVDVILLRDHLLKKWIEE